MMRFLGLGREPIRLCALHLIVNDRDFIHPQTDVLHTAVGVEGPPERRVGMQVSVWCKRDDRCGVPTRFDGERVPTGTVRENLIDGTCKSNQFLPCSSVGFRFDRNTVWADHASCVEETQSLVRVPLLNPSAKSRVGEVNLEMELAL